jgi:DNA-binding NarL/FixJ family response regulator
VTSVPPVRIGLVEDHQVIGVGLAEVLGREPGWSLAVTVRSVEELDLAGDRLDLVLLDLRLDDGSSPGDNVRTLVAAGIPVLAYTAGEDSVLLRAAAKAGVLGIVRKSDGFEYLVNAIRTAIAGETVPSADWAAALDSDSDIADAKLSQREREVLALYASGETAAGVAELMGLSRDTVTNYVGRIRAKYSSVGRAAATKVDLHRRASEDGLLGHEDRGFRSD